MVGVVVSAAVALAGLYLLLTPAAADYAVAGWLFVVLGAAGSAMNLVLWARSRRPRADRGVRRRP